MLKNHSSVTSHGAFMSKVLPLFLMLIVLTSCKDDPVAPLPVAESDPVIFAIQPDSAYPGDEIVITGEHFSPITSANVVTFTGGKQGTVVAASSTALVVVMPMEVETGKIRVAVGGRMGESPENLTVLEATIAVSFAPLTPAKVAVGDTIQLESRGIADDATKVTVKFGAAIAELVALTADGGDGYVLTVRVPAGATSGPVTLQARGKTAVTSRQIEIVTRLLTYKNCVVEIAGVRVQVDEHKIYRHYTHADTGTVVHETVIDTTYWMDFSLALDTRNFLPPYENLQQGFTGSEYKCLYSVFEPIEKRTSKMIKLVIDSDDSALIFLYIDNNDTPSFKGGNSSTAQTERKSLMISNQHSPASASHQYELTGDDVRSAVEQLSYSKTYWWHQNTSGDEESFSTSIKSYEIPASAKITIRFFD